MNDRIRFTISVDPEVYEAFADLAHAGGVSLSRCIGDWLRDTSEAAQMTAIRVKEVRKSPEDAFRAFCQAVAVEVEHRASQPGGGLPRRTATPVAARGAAAAAGGGSAAHFGGSRPAQPRPPSSNTGGKVPERRGPR
jgi:hypothetical protein